MKCTILHDTAGRLRVHLCCKRMTLRQADVLEYYLLAVDGVRSVKVYDRTRDAVVVYDAERERMIRALEMCIRDRQVVKCGLSGVFAAKRLVGAEERRAESIFSADLCGMCETHSEGRGVTL